MRVSWTKKCLDKLSSAQNIRDQYKFVTCTGRLIEVIRNNKTDETIGIVLIDGKFEEVLLSNLRAIDE